MTKKANIFWSNIDIFGQKACVCDSRIPIETKKPELFYYGIRHSDEDCGRPSTIEERVIVNHWGTLVTTKELDFRGLNYIALNDKQIESIMESEATQEETDEYLSSLQEDRAIAAQERAIHIGEHGGALDE